MWHLIKNVRVIAAVLVVGAIAAVAFWPDSIAVDVVPVGRGSMQVTIDEEGETRVRDRFVISAPVAGRLQRVELEPGDPVMKGETVARLVPADAPLLDPRVRAELSAAVEVSRAALLQAQAERDRAAANLERSRDVLRRRSELLEAGAVSREDFETARAEAKTAEGALRAAEAAVTQSRHQVEVARARLESPAPSGGRAIELRAPVSGVVLKRLHESEAVVPAGERVIEIGNSSHIEVVSDLLSTDAVRVKAGDGARIEQWGGGQPLEARVRRVEPSGFMKVSALGVEEQRVNVIIDFADPTAAGHVLGDGYRVEVRIVEWRADNVVTAPVGALFRRGDTWATFVAEGGVARLRTIEIGHRNNAVAEIVKGVQPGEHLVLHPPDTLSDGARVARRE